MRPARALLWACSLYVALLAVLFAGAPGGLGWFVAALLAGLVLLALLRGGLLRRRPRVYLSHRRSDSAAEAAGVVTAVRRRHGHRAVVIGPPAVRFGASLRDEVGQAVGRCDAVCVVIGPDWTTSRDGSGRRRLMNVRDPVRVEVETALHSGRATVPVLVGGAVAPDADDLPETMRGLVDHPPVTVSASPDGTRHADLLARLESSARPTRWSDRLLLLGVVVALAAPFGIVLVREATEGVGYLDEPAVAPDGVRVVAVVRGGLWAPPALRIWNSLTGATEAEYRYRADEPAAGALAWSPDGRAVAVGGDDGSLTLRSADTLATTRTLTGYRGSFRATGVGWSPDGMRLAAVDGTGTLRIWRADDGAAVGAVPVFATYTGRVVWSPSSDAVAVRCTDAPRWRSSNCRPTSRARSAGWPAPGRRPPSRGHRTARASPPGSRPRRTWWCTAAPPTGSPRRPSSGRRPGPGPWRGHRTGRPWPARATGPSGDGVVRVFDGRTGTPTGRFAGGSALAQNPVWAPDGTAVAVADGAGIVTVPVRGAAPSRWESPQQPYGSRVLAWTVDGRLITAGGRDHVVRVWHRGGRRRWSSGR